MQQLDHFQSALEQYDSTCYVKPFNELRKYKRSKVILFFVYDIMLVPTLLDCFRRLGRKFPHSSKYTV